MSNMGFGMWHECGTPSCYVSPKSNYKNQEDFREECELESDGFYAIGIIRQGYARWFPVAPEGMDIEGGTYSFCSPGRGAFPVWVADVKEIGDTLPLNKDDLVVTHSCSEADDPENKNKEWGAIQL